MKAYDDVQIIEQPSVDIRIGDRVANAFGLEEKSLLHGMLLTTNDNEIGSNPDFSIILSPFPVPSWNNLIRTSITVNPQPSMLNKLMKSLLDIGLFCRYLESSNGLDFEKCRVYSNIPKAISNKSNATSGGFSVEERFKNLIIPSTVITLELPVIPVINECTSGDEVPCDSCFRKALSECLGFPGSYYCNVDGDELVNIVNLHKALRYIIENPGSEKDDSVKLLNSILQSKNPDVDIKVDWISPMNTLNRLGNLKSFYREDDDIARVIRTRARKKFVVQKSEDLKSLMFQAQEWRNLIWSQKNSIPGELAFHSRENIMVEGHIDSQEKVIVYDFFRQNSGVLAFEIGVTFPARGLEHEWISYVFQTVGEAGGNIINATSFARTDGDWSKVRMFIIFKIERKWENGKGKDRRPDFIEDIISCFRNLQIPSKKFKKRLKNVLLPCYRSLEGIRDKVGYDKEDIDGFEVEKALTPSYMSTLHVYNIHGSKDHVVHPLKLVDFHKNPYSFLKPLNEDEKGSSERFKLVDRICERLKQGENVSLIGAHRSGKTTVLNRVYYRLLNLSLADSVSDSVFSLKRDSEDNYEDSKGDQRRIMPIMINAATTPPHSVFGAILNELYKKKSKRNRMAREFNQLVEALKRKVDLRIKFPFVDLNVKSEALKRQSFDSLSWKLTGISRAQGVEILKDVMEDLAIFIESIDVSLVILIDEIGGFHDWGNQDFLKVWRHVIENDKFGNICWLISATRPISETENFSPITNVFKEYNVGSLRKEDSESLMNKFDGRMVSKCKHLTIGCERSCLDEKGRCELEGEFYEQIENGVLEYEYWSSENGDEERKVYPVITFEAKVLIEKLTSALPYFMQVTLYHVYHHVTHSAVPIANKHVSLDVIEANVLTEISDYIEHQWSEISPEIRRQLSAQVLESSSVDDWRMADDEFLQKYRKSNFSPKCQKMLMRAGLQGDDDVIIAPIVVLWLIHEGQQFKEV